MAQAAITIALVDDYDVVVTGVAHMLAPYSDRVLVTELDANEPVDEVVDIVLYDAFAQPESDDAEIAVLIDNPRCRKVVVYTWNFQPGLVASAQRQGVSSRTQAVLWGIQHGFVPDHRRMDHWR